MPYITPVSREIYDETLKSLIDDMNLQGDFPGDLTYLLYRLCLGFLTDEEEPPHYADYSSAVGCLECCKLELYRRVAADYENEAIKRNGDIS